MKVFLILCLPIVLIYDAIHLTVVVALKLSIHLSIFFVFVKLIAYSSLSQSDANDGWFTFKPAACYLPLLCVLWAHCFPHALFDQVGQCSRSLPLWSSPSIDTFVQLELCLIWHLKEQSRRLLPAGINSICSSADIVDFPFQNPKAPLIWLQ